MSKNSFVLVALWLGCSLAAARGSHLTLLHEFSSAAGQGRRPEFGVTLLGSDLYVVTRTAEAPFDFLLTKVGRNGAGFQVMHQFASSAVPNFRSPDNGPIAVASTLYGTALSGGGDSAGGVYRFDSGGLQSVYELDSPNDGRRPNAVASDGTMLYGTTELPPLGSPTPVRGSIFRVGLDGSGYETMHVFDGPFLQHRGELTVAGSVLYGTSNTSSVSPGLIYKINTDGTGFTVLREFPQIFDPNDGSHPEGPLLVSGSTIYGTTRSGGQFNTGTIFRMSTDGTGFQILHEFGSVAQDGFEPASNLVQIGSTLYGTATLDFDGIVFGINLDGSGYRVMHRFAGDDGSGPIGDLVAVGDTLYGATRNGGQFDEGTVFALTVPEPSGLGLGACGAAVLLFVSLIRRRSDSRPDLAAPARHLR